MQLHDAQGKRLYLTADERRAFIAASVKAERPVRTLCAVLHDTGCRISELTTHQFSQALQSGGGGASRCRQAWSRRMPRLNRDIRLRRRLRGCRSGAFFRRA